MRFLGKRCSGSGGIAGAVIEMGLIDYVNDKLGIDLANKLNALFVKLWIAFMILIAICIGITNVDRYNLPAQVVIDVLTLEAIFVILFAVFYVLSLLVGYGD